jgi:hypothetical protein
LENGSNANERRIDSLGKSLCLGLRLFGIAPDDFIGVFRLARHPPTRFSTHG